MTSEQIDFQFFIKKLLTWRKTATAVHHGQTLHYVPQDGVYVIFRYDDRQLIMVILNKNREPATLDLGRFRSILKNADRGYDVLLEKEIEIGESIQLEKAGPVIVDIMRMR